MPRSSQTRSLQPDPSCSNSPVTAAFEWSVTCRSPSERIQATHESTVPKHRSRSAVVGRVGEQPGDLRGRLVRCERQPVLDLGHDALTDGAQVLPPERGRDRLTRGAVPHDRAGALVRDPDRGDRIGPCVDDRRAGGVEHAGDPSPPRRTRRGPAPVSTAANGSVVDRSDRRRVVDQRRTQPGCPDVDDEDHGASCMLLGRNPFARTRSPRNPPTRPAPTVTDRLNNSANQRTSLPRARRIATNSAWATR